LGQRSRKRRPVPPPGGAYARSRARDEAARAALEPLAPGERPRAVTVAAVVAALIALANLGLYLAGWEVAGNEPSVLGVLAICGVMTIAAVGMWQRRYWAVLGFEMLLGITIVFAAMALLVASNLEAVVRSVVTIALAAPLFWFLIRAMARLQMPERPRRGDAR
jgi:hypothetical protein